MKMIHFRLRIIFVIASAILMVSLIQCTQSSVSSEEGDTAGHKTDYQEINFNREKNKLEANLRELRDRIDEKLDTLEKKIDETSAFAKENLSETKESLTNQRAEINKTLDDIAHSSEDSWEDVKVKADNSYERLENAFGLLETKIHSFTDEKK